MIMKTDYQNGSSDNQNGIRANERASKANKEARKARESRDKAHNLSKIISDWRDILSGSPILLLTLCFVLFAVAEIVYSWEMYREFLSAFFGNPHWTIVLLLGFVIVCGAAYVSHLLSKSMSSNLFDLEVYNYRFISKKGSILEEIAVEYIEKDRKQDLIYGLIGMLFLLSIVTAISWQRSFLMTEATGNDDYSLIQKIFPVIIVLLEILTGIYIGLYLIPLWKNLIKKWRAEAKFNKHLDICSTEDKMVKALLEQASISGELLFPSKEMADSFYRIKNRSQNNYNYVDEIFLKQIELTVLGNNNQPVDNAHVIGVLQSNQSVVGSISNAHGKLSLFWETNDNAIEKIIVNNIITKTGPFMANTAYVISIIEPQSLTA